MTKEFIQVKLSPNDNLEFNETTHYSKNLIPDNVLVMGIGIYALPGTNFQINQLNDKVSRPLIINGLGMFQMDVEDRPITSLFVSEESFKNTKEYHPIIIDLICQRGVNLNEQ